MLFPFGIFRAAVFAEPAVTEIEEVVSLIQEIRSRRSEVWSQKSEVRRQKSKSEVRLISDPRLLFSYRRMSPRPAGAARRTGTVKRLPLRIIST